MERPLKKYSFVWVIALLISTVCSFPIFVLGLAVPMYAVWPMTLCCGALLAAIVASLMDTYSGGPDRTRSRILLTIGVAEVVALALAGAIVAIPVLNERGIDLILVSMGLAALGACWASWRFRKVGGRLAWDIFVAVGLVAVAVIIVMQVVSAVCLRTGCVA